MFLSKRSNGIYYLWFVDKKGKRRKVSCRTACKSVAMKFVRSFAIGIESDSTEAPQVSLLEFAAEYDAHIKGRYTLKTREVIDFAFRQFNRVASNPSI